MLSKKGFNPIERLFSTKAPIILVRLRLDVKLVNPLKYTVFYLKYSFELPIDSQSFYGFLESVYEKHQ